MPRVTGFEVKEIFATSLEALALDPFIMAASLLVDEVLSDQGYSEERLKEIERWLAAHFAAIRDPRRIEQAINDQRVRLELTTAGDGLYATSYGRQAVVLDTSGTLARLVTPPKAATFMAL